MERFVVQRANESGADESDWLPSQVVKAANAQDAVDKAGEYHAGYRTRPEADSAAAWSYWIKTLGEPPEVVPAEPPFEIKRPDPPSE